MLHNKTVEIVHHFENPQTGYRKVVSLSELDFQFFVSKRDIGGKFYVSTFIVSSEDIHNYENDAFHEDYRGFMFDFDRGTIMAVADQFTLDVELNFLDILDRESIFSIVRNSDKSKSAIECDISNDKIVIKITEKDFKSLSRIKGIPSLQSTINSIFIIPVLIDIMHRIFEISPDERDINYGMCAWYRVIRRALKSNFGIDIEQDDVERFRILPLAQKLVETPISNSLSLLSETFSVIVSEEL